MKYNKCKKGGKCMISENIRILRKNKKWTQEELAEKLDVSRQAVAKWESGETIPDINNCMVLAKLFEVTLDDLVNYDSKEKLGYPIPPKGKHLFGLVKIGEKGQIVIPAKARKIFQLSPGDELLVLGDEGQGIALVKAEEMLRNIKQMMSFRGDE